jgi:ribose/xylose/arabinose/galactoside ABC-type transport system permease subunit
MTGGRGSLLGALLGAAVIFLIENLLGALGLSSFWSQAVYGATLIAAVVFAALTVARGRDNSKKRASANAPGDKEAGQ